MDSEERKKYAASVRCVNFRQAPLLYYTEYTAQVMLSIQSNLSKVYGTLSMKKGKNLHIIYSNAPNVSILETIKV